MKRIIFTVLAVLLALSSTRLAHADSTPKNVTFARTHYAQIECNLKNYRRIQIDYPDQSPEGWTFVVYSHNGTPRKIVALLFGERGQTRHEYYFWNGRLFFVLETTLHYDKPIELALDEKTWKRTQKRFYFANGRMVRWIANDGKIADLKSAQAAQQERENLDEARQYLAKASKLLG